MACVESTHIADTITHKNVVGAPHTHTLKDSENSMHASVNSTCIAASPGLQHAPAIISSTESLQTASVGCSVLSSLVDDGW